MKKHKSSLCEKIKTIMWAFKLAWKIDKKMLLVWFGLSISLAVLPAVALIYNKIIISSISNFLSSGVGNFKDVVSNIIVLGAILTAVGLSGRINGELLYMMMYDSYYIGMEEVMMDCIQKVEMKTLLDKDIRDEHNAIINRGGSLTGFISSVCTLTSKIVSIVSLLLVAISVSKVIFIISIIYIIITIYINSSFTEELRVDVIQARDDERAVSYFQKMPETPGIAKELRIYESKDQIIAQWNRAYKKIEKNYNKRNSALEIRSFLSGIGFYIFMTGIIIYSIFRVYSGHMKADVFLMIYVMCQSMSSAISCITKSFLQVDDSLFSLERQRNFITNVPMSINAEQNKLNKHPSSETVFEAKNLTFCYEEGVPVLKNINLKIHKGETIALVGINGSGKSTLVKLLLEVYKQTSGELLFFGIPYSEYKRGFINSCIGAFFQKFYIFHATLKENVGFGDIDNIDDEEKIIKALSKGGAENILHKLPKGIKNWIRNDVEKEGAALSGGEKQKIAVSRAHMSDKEIMIFDEPAAALDPIAEMEQFMNIKEKINDRTAILISHRVGFARLADRIIVLNDGEVAEEGTHDELISKNGIYAEFFNKQAQWYDTESSSSSEVMQ